MPLPAGSRTARDTPGGSAPYASTVPYTGEPPVPRAGHDPHGAIRLTAPTNTQAAHGCGSAPDLHRLPPVRV
ncbi:hypothetical protein STRTUCAR8_03351 [Streptomyces turgidiscabies Car8]|uniref:Uncharacterized protein n=1 Tax=Streptomyces turgidiscabies (strain Car8) TaxID=698760 RepID=L7F121_STRT8|nr:hypothetical protein STRTUCAR8_03351 [Streptomyces turgidiscabies Car8]